MTVVASPGTRFEVFGIPIDALTLEETVDEAFRLAEDRRVAQHVVLNAAKVVAMEHDPKLKSVIEHCDLINADGTSIVWASKLLGSPLPERVTGIDLFHAIVRRAAHTGHRIYLLGATAEVVTEVTKRLQQQYPTLNIAGSHDGYWSDDAEVIAAVRDAQPDFLFLGVPSPKKEFWLAEHLESLGVPFVMGVGGTFDIVAGKTKRAPRLWQHLGCEWLYRLLQEPRRMWRRYLIGNALFIGMLIKERRAQRPAVRQALPPAVAAPAPRAHFASDPLRRIPLVGAARPRRETVPTGTPLATDRLAARAPAPNDRPSAETGSRMTPQTNPLGLAVIGAGYWGPNLVRNAVLGSSTQLRWVCDLDKQRAERLADPYAGVRATTELARILDDDRVEAVAIATPPTTHLPLALACLRAGKHVMIEKPIAASLKEAEQILNVARTHRRIVMCDHTYCFTPAVRFIADVMKSGELGELQFLDSVRINLGQVQPDVSVIWDLAPHDLSILDFILPDGLDVVAVAAQGADPLGAGQPCIGYLTLTLSSGAIAHIHVNWLSPIKVRTMMIGGANRTLVWDDLNPTQRVSVYDRSVDLDTATSADLRQRSQVSYRIGDVVSPALQEHEALAMALSEFASAVRENRQPATDGASGVRVLRLLEAASLSLANGGQTVAVNQSLETAA